MQEKMDTDHNSVMLFAEQNKQGGVENTLSTNQIDNQNGLKVLSTQQNEGW